MTRVITVGRGFYNHAYKKGQHARANVLGDVKIGNHYVRVPASPEAIGELWSMATLYAASRNEAVPPAIKGYARKLRDRLEQDFGELLA